VKLTRRKVTPAELLTTAAMLDPPGAVALPVRNEKSSKVTPAAGRPLTFRAKPDATDTTVGVDWLYAHVEHESPPYTVTPAPDASTTTFSANVPQA
jgi:hypothetical protein